MQLFIAIGVLAFTHIFVVVDFDVSSVSEKSKRECKTECSADG